MVPSFRTRITSINWKRVQYKPPHRQPNGWKKYSIFISVFGLEWTDFGFDWSRWFSSWSTLPWGWYMFQFQFQLQFHILSTFSQFQETARVYQIGVNSFEINSIDIDQFKNWNTHSPDKDDVDVDERMVEKLLRILVPEQNLSLLDIPTSIVLFIQRKLLHSCEWIERKLFLDILNCFPHKKPLNTSTRVNVYLTYSYLSYSQKSCTFDRKETWTASTLSQKS